MCSSPGVTIFGEGSGKAPRAGRLACPLPACQIVGRTQQEKDGIMNVPRKRMSISCS